MARGGHGSRRVSWRVSDDTFRLTSLAFFGSRTSLVAWVPHPRHDSGEPRMMPEYQRPFDEVIVALGSDARRGLSAGEAQERLLRYGANELADRAASACLAEVPRAVPGRPGDPSSGRDGHIGRPLALRTRFRVAVRSHRHQRRGAAQRRHGLRPGVASRIGRCRPATDVGRARARGARRRAARRSGGRSRAGRHHPCRGRRHDPRRCEGHPIHGAADGGGGADGRKPACGEG